MKKRLLSALLALALVFVLLPTTALAETPTQNADIYIAGTGWNFEKDGSTYKTVYYQIQSSQGVFLNEFGKVWTTNPYLEITRVGNDVTITVHGDMKISSNDSCIESAKSYSGDINLIITGTRNDTLTLTNSSIGDAIYSHNGDVTIKGGITVNAYSTCTNPGINNARGIYVHNHNLTISGANTKVNVESMAAYSTVKVDGGNITISDGATLTAKNTSGDKAISFDSITADGYDFKYWTTNGYTTLTGEDKATNIQTYSRIRFTPTVIEKDSNVLIAKENAVVGVRTSLGEGNGYYTYNKDTKTLTLEDVSITNVAHFIQFWAKDSYTIELKGTNTITGVTSAIRVPEKGYNNESLDGLNVTITGTGSLNVTANTYAIDMQVGNLIFNSTGNITLTTNTNYLVQATVRNALHVAGKITIDNTKYDIVGKRQDAAETTETISDSSEFDPAYLNGYTVGETTTLFKTITITPAAAKDSTISYNRKTLKQGGIIKGEISGTATVATKGNTITLNNFKGTQALSFEATLADSTLVLEGTNTLSSIVTTQMGLTISGSGSLTVGSIRVTNNDNISADLTITGGAHVTVNRPSEDKPAVEVSGNLTVTGEGTQLSAECTAATNPAIEVGGNVTISGNPGTNAYTVKAYNKYDTPRDRDDKLRPSQMPSAFEISGNLSISGSAQVMAQTDSDGAAVWMPKEKVISVVDASLIAQNSSHNFSTISFGDGSDMGNIYAKGQVNIVAENMLHSSSSLAHRAIKAFIYNHYSTGDSNPYYINVVSEGVQSGGKVNVIPGHCTSTGGYKVTITRGDAYTTPQVAANYTIAGQTMYVGKYYKTDANGNITDGTARDYNIYCDSENDFTLNNATISSTGTGGSTGVIMTNLNASSNEIHIKLIGTNSINNAGHHAILGEGAYSTIFIENAENASNASLTISGNYLPVYSYGNVTINAEVVIKNTNGNLISTNKDGHANGAFDLGSGYKCYASTSTTGNLLEEFNSANYSTYKYLRVTTLTLETGGGSTHQHVWDEAWHDTGDYHHAHQCTICKAYDTTTQELHNVTGHRDNHDGSHSNICGSCGYSAKVSHSYTWAPNANDNEKHIGTCVCGNVVEKNHNFVGDVCSDCGYDKSTGTTCEHVWTTEWTIDTVDNEYHWHKCIKCNAITDKKPHAYTIVTDSGTNHIRECECKVFYVEDHISSDWIIDTPATATTAGSMHKECTVCKHKMQTEVIPATGEIEPPTPDNPGTIVIIRPAEEEKPAQQPNPSTGANDLVGLAVAAAVAAALGSAALLRKHD